MFLKNQPFNFLKKNEFVTIIRTQWCLFYELVQFLTQELGSGNANIGDGLNSDWQNSTFFSQTEDKWEQLYEVCAKK